MSGFTEVDGRHPRTYPGCTASVPYDDEPFCFGHSPDEGSSVRGYSYRATHPSRHRFSFVLDAATPDGAWEAFWAAVAAGQPGFDTIDVVREDVS